MQTFRLSREISTRLPVAGEINISNSFLRILYDNSDDKNHESKITKNLISGKKAGNNFETNVGRKTGAFYTENWNNEELIERFKNEEAIGYMETPREGYNISNVGFENAIKISNEINRPIVYIKTDRSVSKYKHQAVLINPGSDLSNTLSIYDNMKSLKVNIVD